MYDTLHDILHRSLDPIQKQDKGLKFQLRCKILLEKYSYENERDIVVDVWFPAETRTVTTMHQISPQLEKSVGDMMSKFDAFSSSRFRVGCIVDSLRLLDLFCSVSFSSKVGL